MGSYGPPIFILGVARRSGTNYLSDLLAEHPDCVTAAPIHEDYLLLRAGHLRDYVDAVTQSWPRAWRVPAETRAGLLRRIGDGILQFLQDGRDGCRVVTKSPHVDNLDLFFDLFPDAYLLLLVRDGRNVVASTVQSFAVNEEKARREWAAAGRLIVDFDAKNRDAGLRYCIVRYEDLLEDLPNTVTTILRFCDLDPDRYDFRRAEALPVRGSSALRAASGVIHWQPVERNETFRPNDRWREWNEYQRARFALVAGDVQRALGYEVDAPATTKTLTDRVRGRIDDVTWWLRKAKKRLLGDRTGPHG